MKFIIPETLLKSYESALRNYLGRNLQYDASIWESIYEAMDILDQAQVIRGETTRTFRQLYAEYIERPFADKYIERLLASNNVPRIAPG